MITDVKVKSPYYFKNKVCGTESYVEYKNLETFPYFQ